MVTIYNGGFKQHNGTFNIGYVLATPTVSNLILSLDATNIASYPGSGTTWFDISGYGNNATLTAATASNFNNYAIKFNKTTNTRAIVSTLDLSTTNAITINMWVKIKTLPVGGGDTFRFLAELSDNYNSFSDSFFTAIATEVSTNRWFTQDKGNVGYNAKNLSTPLPQTNTWYNFTVVYDHTQAASNERTFYIDGVNQTNIASTEGGTTFNSDNTNNFGNRPLYIGGRSTTAVGSFSSDMDLGVFQVYNTALNATQVSQSYESYKTNYLNIVTSGSVFLLDATNATSYPGSGTTVYDVSGNNNTGSLNGPVYNTSSSFTLDGANDYIRFNSGSAINDLTKATWTMWLRWTEDVGITDTSFIYKSDNNNTAGWFISVQSNRIGVQIVTNTNKQYYLPSTENPGRNVWYMLSVTWDGTIFATGGINMYINGVKNTATPFSNSAGIAPRTTDAAQVFDIGNNRVGSSNYFGGDVGFIQIHNRVLTDAEVLQNYNATKKIYGL